MIIAFDGDEMNIFVPQSVQAQLELAEIADVKRQIISPKHSAPIIGVVQDNLLGAYNLTQPTMSIDWKDAMNIISYTTIDDFSAFKKDKEYSGQELFSLIIPSDISTKVAGLEIDDGKIKKGVVKGDHLKSGKTNSLIHLIWQQYGISETKRFLDNTQRMINNFNMVRGFTVGIGDTHIPAELEEDLHKLFEEKKLKVLHLITEMENNPDILDKETFEQSVYAELNTVRDDVSKLIMNNLDEENNFNIMITSGSKGSAVNMGQMSGLVGQQAVEGERLKKKVNGRSLPYFFQNDDSALAGGFIEQPFLRGTHAISFIIHNMSSREGLIDTAIKSVTGDTPVIITDNGKPKRVLIGEWIDLLMKHNSDKVSKQEEKEMETLKVDNIKIPTTDNVGNVTWGNITAVTRHDPTDYLYKIKTTGGREVTVAESKSLLVWDNEKATFEQVYTPDVKVGDYMPTTCNLPGLTDNKDEDKKVVIKLIDGFISSNNVKISENKILFTSENKQLVEQVNFMLNGFGIFGEFSGKDKLHILTIREYFAKHFAKLFAKHFANTKLPNLEKLGLLDTREYYKVQNDVVLDRIISINKMEAKDRPEYAKLYDLTVPSTLNFGLANGLHVVDTAETGYLQRKLIKSMEDAMIKYDCTVRNANNTILQFLYGDSGVDSTKQAIHISKLITMGNKEVADKYKFTSKEIGNFSSFTGKQNDDFYKQLLGMRDSLRRNIFKHNLDYKTFNDRFRIPVNINRIVDHVLNSKEKNGKLDPKYILEKLDDILEYSNTKVTTMNKKDSKDKKSIKYQDEMTSKILFKFVLYEVLAPKVCIFEHKLTKGQFDRIIEEIIEEFNDSVVEPGEMVGTVAAQSIGEPLTQMTLNSVDWREKIILRINGETRIVRIGKFIDHYIKENPQLVQRPGDNKQEEMGDTYYVDTSKEDIQAISVDKDGKVAWNKVDALTKHLPMNKDGTNDLVKIKTRLGKTVRATKAKSFLTRVDNEIVPIRGDEVQVGMKIPLVVNGPENSELLDCVDLNRLDKQELVNTLGDVYLDEIINFKLVKPSNTFVYDLTVSPEKTFCMASGMLVNDTFHSAGIGGMGTANMGVSRFKELLSFSKNMKMPITIIYLEKEIKDNTDLADKIASYIKHTTLADIRDTVEIYYDPNPLEKDGFMEKDNVYNVFYSHNPTKRSCQSDITTLPWLYRITFNKEEMLNKNITLLDIKAKFCNHWETRYTDVKGLRKEERQYLEKVTQCSILSNNENDRVPTIHIRIDMSEYDMKTLVGFLDTFIDTFHLKGLSKIQKILSRTEERYVSFDNDDQEMKNEKENVVYTQGVDLDNIRYINGIDINRTISNDVVTTYERFGIEAARSLLLRELNIFFAMNPINFQHVSVLIDIMTNNGALTSIDRHGLNRLETDPLSRASFEKTVDQLIAAAVFGQVDHMKSVSSRIMGGLCIKGGTGLCNIILDTDLLENSEYIQDIEHKYKKTFTELAVDAVMDDLSTKESEGIFIPE